MVFPKELLDKPKESKGKESRDKFMEFKVQQDLLQRKEQPPTEPRADTHPAILVVLEPVQDLLMEERDQR